jgi:hypothetical protein
LQFFFSGTESETCHASNEEQGVHDEVVYNEERHVHDMEEHDMEEHDMEEHDMEEHDMEEHDMEEHDMEEHDMEEHGEREHDMEEHGEREHGEREEYDGFQTDDELARGELYETFKEAFHVADSNFDDKISTNELNVKKMFQVLNSVDKKDQLAGTNLIANGTGLFLFFFIFSFLIHFHSLRCSFYFN